MTTLRELASEAAGCTRCDLYRNATGTVFGEGPGEAELMLVGEQPGDVEDRQGRPFVGPAGRLLDRALADSGISRRQAYLTNAVKHFKFQQSGKRRLHKPPNRTEIVACRTWLESNSTSSGPLSSSPSGRPPGPLWSARRSASPRIAASQPIWRWDLGMACWLPPSIRLPSCGPPAPTAGTGHTKDSWQT